MVTTCRDVAVAAGFNPSALYSLRVTVHATVIALHFPNSTNCVAASSITDDGYCFQDVLDWIEQGLTSPPTQYRLSGRQFYRPKDKFFPGRIRVMLFGPGNGSQTATNVVVDLLAVCCC